MFSFSVLLPMHVPLNAQTQCLLLLGSGIKSFLHEVKEASCDKRPIDLSRCSIYLEMSGADESIDTESRSLVAKVQGHWWK